MTTAGTQESTARRRILSVFLTQGTLGLGVLLGVTWLRWEQTQAILAAKR